VSWSRRRQRDWRQRLARCARRRIRLANSRPNLRPIAGSSRKSPRCLGPPPVIQQCRLDVASVNLRPLSISSRTFRCGLRRDAALPVRQNTRQGREGGALPKPLSDSTHRFLIVGGNIAGYTRTMTTTIVLETNKGELPVAVGARARVLIGLSIAVSTTEPLGSTTISGGEPMVRIQQRTGRTRAGLFTRAARILESYRRSWRSGVIGSFGSVLTGGISFGGGRLESSR
jgi:hypothetical protein